MLLAAFIIGTLCFVALIVMICTAPEGWQDKDGFHTGRPTLAQLLVSEPCADTGLDMRLCPCDWCCRLRKAVTNERRLDAREGDADRRPFVADASAPFHATGVTHARP